MLENNFASKEKEGKEEELRIEFGDLMGIFFFIISFPHSQ